MNMNMKMEMVWKYEKMPKYGEAECWRKMAYLGHMSSVLDFVKC
jgi:hypothetical protein